MPPAVRRCSTAGKVRVRPAVRRGRAAFTLVELLLVLSLLLIVTGISLPTLKHFFRSRTVDSEARRLLSLVRYGQARAAAEGVPMVLWVDAQERTYGLQAETGYLDLDTKAIEYEVDEGLSIEASAPPVLLSSPGTGLSTSLARRQTAARQTANLPAIRMTTDGFLDESSPETIVVQEADVEDGRSLWITQTGNRLSYEVRDQPPTAYRR